MMADSLAWVVSREQLKLPSLYTCGSSETPTRAPVTQSFDSMRTLLDRLEIPLGVAEVHGVLCGLMCSESATVAKSRWFAELLDAAGLKPDAVAQQAEPLRELDRWFGNTIDRLNDTDLRFEPLLPDDSASLSSRVGSLGEFCGGFCYGVGIGSARRGNDPLPTDTRELIEDFQAIDGTEAEALDEGDEDALAELIEYVRVGVLLVHEELKPIHQVSAPVAETSESRTPSSMTRPPIH